MKAGGGSEFGGKKVRSDVTENSGNSKDTARTRKKWRELVRYCELDDNEERERASGSAADHIFGS
jgi:hypothetical protein